MHPLPERGETPHYLLQVAQLLQEHPDEPMPLARLAEQCGVSASRLQREFKSRFGLSPKAYQDGLRLNTLRGALRQGTPVTEAIFEAGFGSVSRVYGESRRQLGMAPSRYRKGGEGETLHYATGETPVGLLMIAATSRGICFAQFGDSEAALLEALQNEFPNAECLAAPNDPDKPLSHWMQAIHAYLAAEAPCPSLPLDMRGTAFQLLVWEFLIGVPEGETLSYTELATRLKRPKAVRAVASACARNRIGLLIPCHRVLRGDGSLGGYRWGLDKKRKLLDIERSTQAPGKE